MLEDWQEFTSLILMTKITKKLKMRVAKLERPLAATMPCTRKAQSGTTKVVAKQEVASQKIPKTIYGCIGEFHESTRQRVESPPTKHEDHIAGKGFTSMSHYNLGTQICSYASSNEDSGCKKNAVDKEWNKPETIPAWVFRGDTVKDDSGAFAVFTEQRLVRVQNDGRKSNGCYCLTTQLWRTSSWRNIGVHPGKKWRMLENYSKFPNQNVRMYGSVFQNMNGRSHRNTLKIPLFLLNETYMDTHLRDSCGKDSSRKC